MTKSKTIFSETIHSNPWYAYKHDKYVLPNGVESDYYYLETHGNAMVVPVLDDGRLVLVAQYRYLGDKPSVEFPCGGVKSDESPMKAAARELLEETGYVSEELIKAGTFEGLNGLARDTSHLFVAMEIEKKRDPSPESTEILEVILRRPDELDDMIKRGEIWDGQTLAAWAMVRQSVISRL
ncbi:MAG: NUDIX hydrolase [Candidatus Magasanikbacteria bacterium GW2011_GWA2_46_17]|uniref:NUDIX hydrolase n=1 Tax=Candidatus Magasanikbacteria bacterium GW2011_GWA2_46_17 TaxID=1619042 RepID=A0A0G1R8Q5_9BACT|nr:MAG: NUDIX hydrolase [Candidatus Magasanikbacteria bacterium GW2011_GWA2_46_17]